MRRLPIALMAALPALADQAGAQIIIGQIFEEGTRAPVAGAQVGLLDPQQRVLANTVSDSMGVFRLRPNEPGSYTIRVEHIAYAAYVSEPLELGAGETLELEIRVGRTVIPLQPLTVTARTSDYGRLAGFYERRRTFSFGRFLTRSDIESRSNSRTSDMLRTIPGVTITPVRIRARAGPERYMVTMRGGSGRGCEPALYIDGVRVRQAAETTIDDMLSIDALEGVEVYTSSAGAPPQFTESGTCGVILFWTRQGEAGEKFSWKRLLAGVGILAAIIFVIR